MTNHLPVRVFSRDRRHLVIAQLRRNGVVAYRGRRCVLHGVDPGGVTRPRAYLEDAATGERLSVALDGLVKAQPPRPPSHEPNLAGPGHRLR